MADEVRDSEPEQMTNLVKLYPKDEDKDKWRTRYIRYLSNRTPLEDHKLKDKILQIAW